MRAFDAGIRTLLRSPNLKANLLVAFFLDEGTYRFCDNHIDMSDGTFNWIGASALGDSVEIKSGRDLAAESVTLVLDGNRMAQYGIADPARVLRDILGYLYQQRRVDFLYGFSYVDSPTIQLRIPAYAGKINSARLVDPSVEPFNPDEAPPQPTLVITLDALAARYGRATFRLRTDKDQRQIDATDQFFSFVGDVEQAEQNLYWGKKPPPGAQTVTPGGYVLGSQQFFRKERNTGTFISPIE